MKRTLTQNKTLHSLLTTLQIDADHKQELVLGATSGRTGSSAEMEVMECQQLITHLQNLIRLSMNNQNMSDEFLKGNKLRKKVLSLCYELGWIKGKIVDYERLNNFLVNRGAPKRINLNAYTLQELPGLITQFELMLKKELK